MEDGLSTQTKLSLIKNEREERGLRSRMQKIDLAKSLWVSNSDHNRNVFLRDYSRLISRAQLLSGDSSLGRTQHWNSGVSGLKDVKNRRRIKRKFLPLLGYQKHCAKYQTSETKGSVEKLCEESVEVEILKSNPEEETFATENELTCAVPPSEKLPENDEEVTAVELEVCHVVEKDACKGDLLLINQGSEMDQTGTINSDEDSETTLDARCDIERGTIDKTESENESKVRPKDVIQFDETSATGDTDGNTRNESDGIKGGKVLDETSSRAGDTQCEATEHDNTKEHDAGDFNAEDQSDRIIDEVRDTEGSTNEVDRNLIGECSENGGAESDENCRKEADTDADSETRKMRRSPSLAFITDLGQIEEEDDETMASEKEAPVSIPLAIRSVQTPTRRKIQSIPSLSPIKDEAEDQEEKNSQPEAGETNPVATVKPIPETEPEAESRELDLGSEEDSVDDCIEQVRISNTLPPSDSATENVKPNSKSAAQLPQGVIGCKQVTPRLTKSYTFQKSPRKHSESGGLLMGRRSVGSLAYLVSRPADDTVTSRFKVQPICKRYEQAVIPPEFNLDFITRILRKKAAKNKTDEDDDEDEEYNNSELQAGKKKKVKRRVVISPARPRVVWTPAKWSTLPECRYLRLPPLVQMGQMF